MEKKTGTQQEKKLWKIFKHIETEQHFIQRPTGHQGGSQKVPRI
jgi:hypothetical protein